MTSNEKYILRLQQLKRIHFNEFEEKEYCEAIDAAVECFDRLERIENTINDFNYVMLALIGRPLNENNCVVNDE